MRPVMILSGLAATAARPLPPLTRRGRVVGVAENGMAMTDSMLRAALPGIGMLAERVCLDVMLYVRRAVRDAVVLMDNEKSGRRLIGSFTDSLLKRRVKSAQNMYTKMSTGVLLEL